MEKTGSNRNTKIYIAIAIVLILLALGIYFLYPVIIPGMASNSLEQDVSVVVIGLDDTDSVNKGELAADSVVLAQLLVEEKEIKLTNIIIDDKSFGEDVSDEDIELLVKKVSDITSTELSNYMTLSYQGFIQLVDNLDGVAINRGEELKVPDLNLDLVKGENQLSGQEALNYARWYNYKKNEQDRIERQQQIISAVLDKALRDKTILDLPQMFTTTLDTFKLVDTNLGYTTMTDVVQYLMNNKDVEISYNILSENTSK